MIANYERNLKAIDSGRVTKDIPAKKKKKRVKGSIRGISEILSPCDKENNSARYTERRIEVFFFFFFFWLHGVFTAVLGLSLLRKVETTLQLWRTDCSLLCLLLLQSTDSGASVLWPTGLAPHSLWNLPKSGMEPRSPALAGRFLTAGPPRKS